MARRRTVDPEHPDAPPGTGGPVIGIVLAALFAVVAIVVGVWRQRQLRERAAGAPAADQPGGAGASASDAGLSTG